MNEKILANMINYEKTKEKQRIVTELEASTDLITSKLLNVRILI